MRNLKKVLSLSLALVMLLGMMVVGAGAAEYTDAGEIEYKEAADVLTAIGVMQGRDNGSFDPKAELDRAEGAAIIYRMLTGGMTQNPSAASTGFVDVDGVANYSWASGIIADLANKGIVAGEDATHFNPSGKLNGYAFGKMLLVALGYNADSQGYVGGGWEGNVIRDAYNRGISVTGVVMSNNITREQAAQMALNTLQATMVYQKGGIQVGDVVIPGDAAQDIDNTGSDYQGRPNNQDGKMQFCETYFPNLKLEDGEDDAFGRATKVWTYNKEDVSTVTADAFVTYTAKTKADKIASDLKGYKVNSSLLTATKTPSTDNVVGFVKTNGNDGDLVVTSGNNTYAKAIAGLTANGKVVSIYTDGDETVTGIVTAEYKLAQITNKSANAKSITLSTKDGVNTAFRAVEDGTNKDFYAALDAKEKDDYVIVALDGTTILDLAEPTVESGTYTKLAGDKYTVGGTEYELSYHKDVSALTMNAKTVYDLYLDPHGFVMFAKVQTGDAATSDAFILATSRDGTAQSGYSFSAQLLKTDGTVEWVPVYQYDDKVLGTSEANTENGKFNTNHADYQNKFTTYSVNEDGTYNLSAVATGTNHKTDVTTITTGSPALGSYTANSRTVFLVKQADGSYKVYTGIREVPNMTGITANHTFVNASGVATMVIVNDGAVAGTDNSYIYILKITPSSTRVENSKTIYTYDAIVDGVVGTVDTTINATTMASEGAGLYVNCTTDADGYVTAIADEATVATTAGALLAAGNIGAKYTAPDTVKLTLADGNLTIAAGTGKVYTAVAGSTATTSNSKTVVVADEFVAYRIYDNKAEALVLGSTPEQFANDVIVTVNADGEATAAYVMGNAELPATMDPADLTGTKTISESVTVTGDKTLTTGDAITVAADQTLTINGNLDLTNAASINLSASNAKLVVTGTLTLTSGSFTGGEVTVTGLTTIAGTSQTIASGVTLRANNGLTISGTTSTIAGTVTTTTLDSVAAEITGSVTASGAATLSGDVTGTGTLTVASFSDNGTSAAHAKTKTVGVTNEATVAVLEAVGNKGVANNKLVVGVDSSDTISSSNVWFSTAGTASTTAGTAITGKVTQGSYTATTCYFNDSGTADGSAITWLKDA